MKKILLLLPFCLAFAEAYADSTADTLRTSVVSASEADSTWNDRRQQRQERKEDRKEANKNAQEHLKDEVRDAAEDVKKEAVEVYNETKEALKENFRQAKESLTSWFNENIAANTVGDFAQMQRQNNQLFANSLRTESEWQEYPLDIQEKTPMLEGVFFSAKAAGKPADDKREALAIRVESVMTPIERIPVPFPENYYSGAGTEAVSNMVSKQQFITYKFYGQPIKIHYIPTLRNVSIGKSLEKGVSKAWQYFSDQDFEPVLFQLYQYKEDLGLNDYQYYLLVRQFADLLFAKSKGGENLLFTVFILNQTGYDARFARFQGDAGMERAIVLPFFEEVSSWAYITLANNRYYLMDIVPGKKLAQSSVKVYTKAHANATYPLSLRILPKETKVDPLYGKFQGYTFDERLAQMQLDMPSVPFVLCAEADFSRLMQKSFVYKLLPELDSMVSKKQDENLKERISEREQQEIKILSLCGFLNASLSSQAKQSAKLAARSLYPEVMFLKKGSGDILDRSILLCQIANRILDIPAVLLVYPDFAMAAVGFASGESKPQSPFYHGDYVELDGNKYLLCGKLPKSLKNPGQVKIYRW